tara:strand:- start:16534 stop:16746 length:213 start_codon:yes stop_codon:yes gene_type:complete
MNEPETTINCSNTDLDMVADIPFGIDFWVTKTPASTECTCVDGQEGMCGYCIRLDHWVDEFIDWYRKDAK